MTEQAAAESLRQALDQNIQILTSAIRNTFAERLNSTVRRLFTAESRELWRGALLEAALSSCQEAILFSIHNTQVRIDDWRGLELPDGSRSLEFPLDSAQAFTSAVESADVTVALSSEREIGPLLFDLLGDRAAPKFYLFPLIVRNKTLGLLCAQSTETPVETETLELLATVAAASATAGTPALTGGADLVQLPPAAKSQAESKGRSSAAWNDLSRSEQELHLRAQRFARTRVAGLLLRESANVRAGRAHRDLYGLMKNDIDSLRSGFREEFKQPVPSMVDYLHLELVRTLAENDHHALGPDYPGPLA